MAQSTKEQIDKMFAGPTKRNHAGNQQPYVPAGNGDESGEYADSTGVNTHFGRGDDGNIGIRIKDKPETKKKEKPIDKKIEDKKEDKKEKVESKSGKEIATKIRETLTNNFGKMTPNRKWLLTQVEDDIDGEYARYSLGFLEKYKPQIDLAKNKRSCCYALGDSTLVYNSTQNDHLVGQTFFHELGHAIDGRYYSGTDSEGRPIGRQYMSSHIESKKYGKTLQEMIYEEIKSCDYNAIKKEYDDGYANLPEVNAYNQFKESEEYKEIQDFLSLQTKMFENHPDYLRNQDLRKQWLDGKISYNEFYNVKIDLFELSQKVQVEMKQKYPRFAELDEKSKKLYRESEKAKENYANSYSGLSDMFEATQGKTINGYGHGLSYWNRSSMRGTEAFAEIYSALTISDKRPLKLMEKYCPKSVEIVKELLQRKVDY